MHIASCLAGLSFNAASLGINHSLAHQLGAHFHIAHGRANAMLLPHIIEYNSMITKNSRSQKTYPRQVEKYCTIARLLGVQNFNTVTTIRALVAWVQFMLREMDIPLSISQTGKCTRAEYFKAIPDMARQPFRMPAPRPIRDSHPKTISWKSTKDSGKKIRPDCTAPTVQSGFFVSESSNIQ